MSQPPVREQPLNAPTVAESAHTVAHNLRIAAELASILAAFEEASVPCVVLKGIPLVHRIGEGLSARRIADNDVLIGRADVSRAIRALSPLGYRPVDFRNLDEDLEDNFEHPLVRVDDDGTFLVCELHWSAFPPSLFRAPEELLWSRTVEVEVGGMRAKVFDPAMQLLHLVSHALQHELSEPRTLSTFGLAWSRWHRDVEYEDLARLARSMGLEYALEYVVAVTRELGLTRGPGPGQRTQRVATVLRFLDSKRLLVNAENTYPERYLRSLAMTPLLSPPRAVGHLLSRAFPKPDWTARRSGLLGTARHYIARPIRPLLRSAGWKPTTAGSSALEAGPIVHHARAVLMYLKIHRGLAARYRAIPLDALLDELEVGRASPGTLTLDDLADAIGLAEKLAPRVSWTPNTCLYRALSRYALLNRYAHSASFVLGVGQPIDEPGHAWVEVGGRPFLERDAPAFPRILTRHSPRQ